MEIIIIISIIPNTKKAKMTLDHNNSNIDKLYRE